MVYNVCLSFVAVVMPNVWVSSNLTNLHRVLRCYRLQVAVCRQILNPEAVLSFLGLTLAILACHLRKPLALCTDRALGTGV